MTRLRARAAVLFLTVALGGPALSLGAAAAPAFASSAAPPTQTKGQAAAGWLARQMTDGSHFVTVFGKSTFPNQGETIDAIFAFAATKSANSYGAKAIGWLEQPAVLPAYIGSGTESYAGATAKATLAAEVRGVNPAKFGKTNLVARLGKLLTKSGRYSDHSKFGDFSNAFSQSLAIIALSRSKPGAPLQAVRYLVASECKNGGFPLNFGAKTCASDPDATALAVQALLAGNERRAAARGLAYLGHVQLAGGGFVAAGRKVPNANTSGLAGEALAAGGWGTKAKLTVTFLRSLQLGCSAPVSRQGALAYDSSGFAASTAGDATAQGILGMADVGLATLQARGSASAAPRLTCAS
jgi:hypothetical protein